MDGLPAQRWAASPRQQHLLKRPSSATQHNQALPGGQRWRRVLLPLILPAFYSVGVLLLLPGSQAGFCLSDWCVSSKVAGWLSVLAAGLLVSSLFCSLSPARARTKTKRGLAWILEPQRSPGGGSAPAALRFPGLREPNSRAESLIRL